MRCAFKIVLCGLGLGLLACGNIPRDNPLDPLNPESAAPKRHLIEAFVNISAHPSDYNQIMLAALDSLEEMYRDRIVIAAYHRSISVNADPYHLAENDIRYQRLLDAMDSDMKGAPDVFFNGIARRIQGASTRETAFFRLQEALLSEIGENENFYLSVATRIESNGLVTKVTVARLGNESAEDIRIRAILTANKGGPYLNHVVLASVESDVIDRLSSGVIRETTLPSMPWSGNQNCHLVVTLVNKETTVAYQSTEITVNE